MISFLDYIEGESWGDSFRVTREQRSIADVLQATVQHYDALQTDTSAAMGICSVLETLDVVFDCVGIYALFDCSLG